jgi:hypothetical protein
MAKCDFLVRCFSDLPRSYRLRVFLELVPSAGLSIGPERTHLCGSSLSARPCAIRSHPQTGNLVHLEQADMSRQQQVRLRPCA